mmetsp:Transcript_1785/g.4523  ORF Transcript_1785/g.4523 Transcript_1785/m.4523 type:complete len:83 (-) Transcript_1785:762-1010(-)
MDAQLDSQGPPSQEANKAHEEWLQRRKEWTAQQQQQQQRRQSRPPTELTYEMLQSYQPFPQPVPLSIVVEALTEIWEEEEEY